MRVRACVCVCVCVFVCKYANMNVFLCKKNSRPICINISIHNFKNVYSELTLVDDKLINIYLWVFVVFCLLLLFF